jgi:hypothetical protein
MWSGVCAWSVVAGLLPAQEPRVPDGYRADVERVIAYLDRACDQIYGFTCTLDRVTVEAVGESQLHSEFDHLRPFLDGTHTGPFMTCVGAVHGKAWFVDLQDEMVPGTRHECFYFDGAWSAQRTGARARVLRRYQDPAVGLAPWLWPLAGTDSFASVLGRHSAEQWAVDELRAERPEDAGANRLFELRFPGPPGHGDYRLEAKVGPDGVSVHRIRRFRGGACIAQLRLEGHTSIGGVNLPTRLTFGDALPMQWSSDGSTPQFVRHWTIAYRDACPDPAAFVAELAAVDELTLDRTLFPIPSIDRQVLVFVAAMRATEPPPPRASFLAVEVPLREAAWPCLADYMEEQVVAGTFLTRADLQGRHAMYVAVAVCGQLRGVALPFGEVLTEAGEQPWTPEQAVECLQRHDLACTLVDIEPDTIPTLQDGFIVLRQAKQGPPQPEAGLVKNGIAVVWSPHRGRHDLDLAELGPTVRLLVSRADAARLGN